MYGGASWREAFIAPSASSARNGAGALYPAPESPPMAAASNGNAVVVKAKTCDFRTGMMEGEGVEVRLLEDTMLSVGAAVGAGTLAEGEDGCAGVASSCAEKSVLAAEGEVAVLAPLRVHLLQRCNGPDAIKQALWT